MVIKPRYNGVPKNLSRGVIDSERIVKHGDSQQFSDELKSASWEKLHEEGGLLLHQLSIIDNRKYYWLRISILVSLVGWVTAFLAVGLSISITIFPVS
jgi:hypothetical protein